MSKSKSAEFHLPPEQQAIRDKCFHPSGAFVDFPIEDVEASIPARFEKIVSLCSERSAVTDGDRQVTYGELNSLANGIAHAVLASGVPAPEPVVLLFNKSIEQIAAMMGVLKAGRAFVLLDTSLPKTRMELVLEHCRCGLAMFDRENDSLAGQLSNLPQPAMAIEPLVDNKYLTENPGLTISPDALATIFYTSGSTGEPKGICGAHATLLHAAMLRTNADGFCVADRVAHLTSGASNAINNCLIALLNGAELALFDIKKEEPGRLARWLQQKRITVCMIAAPLFRTLCESLTPAQPFSDLRLLRLRSDTVCKSDVALYQKHFGDHTILTTGLSSTETCVLTEYYIDNRIDLTCDSVPVGYAMPGKELLLLNDNGDPVGDGEVGEIVVRSKHLTAGYWRNAELTAARFKTDAEHPEMRRYHTGDLGLRLADGCLIHKGRKDFRAKVRGYAVELGEVEKMLREQADVRDAVVLSKSNAFGEARLIAYVVPRAQAGARIKELRDWLKAKLPEYMVPSQFVVLEALPLMSNGKVDRRALPDLPHSRPAGDAPYAAPSTVIEEQLAAIWREVLALNQVGIHDDFFELGGHSLAASRVISRVIQAFKLDLPLKALFDAPTVALMAKAVEQHQGKSVDNQELEHMLREVEALSEEEARKLVAANQKVC